MTLHHLLVLLPLIVSVVSQRAAVPNPTPTTTLLPTLPPIVDVTTPAALPPLVELVSSMAEAWNASNASTAAWNESWTQEEWQAWHQSWTTDLNATSIAFPDNFIAQVHSVLVGSLLLTILCTALLCGVCSCFVYCCCCRKGKRDEYKQVE